MAWFKGSTTDWKDLMDILSEIGSDEHMSAVAIHDGGSGYIIGDTAALDAGTYNLAPQMEVTETQSGDTVATVASIVAGGTGYATGDLVEVVGGTGTVVAVLEVVTEAAGVVTVLQINDPGIYSVQPVGTVATAKTTGAGDDALTVTLTWNSGVTGIATKAFITNAGGSTVTPTDPVPTTSSGAGVGLLVDLTWVETAWETLMNYEPKVAASAVVAAGGTGYSVGDIIIVNEGAGIGVEHATFTVATEAGGVVATVTLQQAGYYSALPTNPATTTADPSTPGGSGCTLTITYAILSDATYQAYKHMVLHNTVTDVYVGIEALNQISDDADCWRLVGLTGFNSLYTKLWDQPGSIGAAVFVPLHDGAFGYNFSITDRRIVGIFNLGGGANYTNMWLGLMDPFMTEDEYPYPQVILGCSGSAQKYTYSGIDVAGMHNPGAASAAFNGPGLCRRPGGVATILRNWYIFSGNETIEQTYLTIGPIGSQYMLPQNPEDKWYSATSTHAWYSVVRINQVTNSTQDNIRRLNNTYILVPCMVNDYANYRVLGQMTGLYWFDNADGALSSGDRIWDGDVAYRVYQNCKKTNKNNMFCILEG